MLAVGIWAAEDGSGPAVASLNTTFNGKNIQGTWHLLVNDHWPVDTGTIKGFAVCFSPATGSACYPNCDNSTTPPILNVNDFSCFLNAFAGGQTYANCDNSTTAPILNVNDFSCFLNRFAAGCS